ncbi:hypothetical protein EU522_01625 [Candidatus Thorarchaeota archaeon]|nr:MAG: hypothetical protein EU522_01625 [Candidatus Thorarchaeota archaeon]
MTESMACPECGKNMERGYLTSREGIYWNKKVPRAIASGIPLTKDVQPVFRFGYIRVYRCKECKILRYFEDSKMWNE